jgi:hypothetical protein
MYSSYLIGHFYELVHVRGHVIKFGRVRARRATGAHESGKYDYYSYFVIGRNRSQLNIR